MAQTEEFCSFTFFPLCAVHHIFNLTCFVVIAMAHSFRSLAVFPTLQYHICHKPSTEKATPVEKYVCYSVRFHCDNLQFSACKHTFNLTMNVGFMWAFTKSSIVFRHIRFDENVASETVALTRFLLLHSCTSVQWLHYADLIISSQTPKVNIQIFDYMYIAYV